MRLVFGLVLMVGLGLAGLAVYMAKGYVQNVRAQLAHERAQRAPVIETVDIYVAEKPLIYGQRVTKEDVRLTAFPKESLPEGIFTTEEELFPKGINEPRTALRSMERNEAVLAVKVTEPGEEAGITSRLQRGMRAFAIKVDASSGVSGFLRPGDRVDVYWTGDVNVGGPQLESGSGSGEVTKLIETGLTLIAIDQVANQDMTEAVIAKTVTVEVSPQQVAALKQAQTTGQLSLSLVGAEDDTVAQAIEVDQRSLLGIPAAQIIEEAPEEEICTIRSRRGAEVIVTRIPCTN